MADEPVRLPDRAEALLSALSAVPERDWEADARAIEARVHGAARNDTDDRWLEAPLPESSPLASAAVVAATPSSSAPPRPASSAPPPPAPSGSSSLLALARSVAQKNSRPEATDIARESLSAAAAARSQTKAIAERVRSSTPASTPPAAPPTPPLARVGSAPPVAAAAAEPSRERVVAELVNRPQRADAQSVPPKKSAGPWVAMSLLGVAAAAVIFVLLRSDPEPPGGLAPELAANEAPGAAQSASLEAPPAPVASAPAVAANAAPTPPETHAAEAAKREVAASAQPATTTHASHVATPAASHVALAAKAARPAPARIVLEETPAPPSAASASAGPLRPAAGSRLGGLPDRPATGAVQAAIGSVMGAARSCVAGASTPTPAQVMFASDGTVKAVTVSGPNAGTPAASCIESALKRARVAPFASPSFALMVWVRP